MHATDLVALVDYSYWARNHLLDVVAKLTPEQYAKPMGNSFSSVRDTVVHLYGAEWIWDTRMRGESPGALPKADEFPDLASLRSAWNEVESRYRALTAGLTDAGIARVINFRTLRGDAMSSPIAGIIQHVVNHGTYHRGQVTTMLRQMGAEAPKSTDLIFYYRERAG